MRILFVVESYLPKPIASGICVLHVQEALFNKGIKSDVVTLGDKYGFIKNNKYGKVYAIPGSINHEEGKKNLKRLYEMCLHFFTWPIVHPDQVRGYYELIKRLQNKNDYDGIFGVSFPAETVLACSQFNNYYIYEMDSLSNNPIYKRGVARFFRHRARLLERYLYNRAIKVFHLKCSEKYYKQTKYKKYSDKFEFVDVPHIIDEYSGEYSENHSDIIQIVYTGSLFAAFRSPEYSIQLIKKLSQRMRIRCDFYSRGDCEEMLRRAERTLHQGKESVIVANGYVDQDTVVKKTQEADFLLSIGNSLDKDDMSLPSKVIAYISTGKPIIHIDGGANDTAIQYLQKYPLSLIIHPCDGIENNVRSIEMFIKDNHGKRLPFDQVKELFYLNTPELTAEKIIKDLNIRKVKHI